MLKKKLKSLKLDRADSIVTAIIVFPLLFMLFITIVDSSIYMADRAQLTGIARDSARTAAIFGGDGNATQMTTLEAAYGQTRASLCDANVKTSAAYNTSRSAIECGIIKNAQSNVGLVAVDLTKVDCTPQMTTSIGQSVTCNINWTYKGIPGSILSFIKSRDQLSIGSSESEVVMNASSLVNR